MSCVMRQGRRILAIDTTTATAIVALGDADGALVDERTWRAGYRHGEELLARIDELLAANGVSPDGIGPVVAGTGPGAFTGVRVGLATAKGLAHGLGMPLVGVSTAEALLTAAARLEGEPLEGFVLLLPAGPSDRVVVRHGGAPALAPGGIEPQVRADEILVAVDLEDRAPGDALLRGRRARDLLGSELLRIGAARLAAGDVDDIARVVPEYVTLPRGIREQAGEVEWSRDHR